MKAALLLVASVAAVVYAAPAEDCSTRCSSAFGGKSVEFPHQEGSCNRGCRLYKINHGIENFGLFSSPDLNSIMEKCYDDCQSSFGQVVDGKIREEKISSCKAGCKFQEPLTVQHKQSVLGNLFGGHGDGPAFTLRLGVPRVIQHHTGMPDAFNIEMPKIFGTYDYIFGGPKRVEGRKEESDGIESESNSSLSSVFDAMHKQMQDMMNWSLQNVQNAFMPGPVMINNNNQDEVAKKGENGEEMPKMIHHGAGKLVVIKDGPGYHEENTYNIGPDADIGKIMQQGMNDMMSKNNPLENFFKPDDVETVDPFALIKGGKDDSSSEEEDDHDDSHEKKGDENENGHGHGHGGFDLEVLGPFTFPVGRSENQGAGAQVNGFDFNEGLEGPRLPESGLRPQHVDDADFRRFLVVDGVRTSDVCSQDSHKMKWSDWVSCLHLRHGLPRWLTAATICLGIIFALWLCLVIPSNAPKQKVKKGKKCIDTKEVEAMNNPHLAVILAETKYPIDLPPSYDDVTKKVNLEPVHSTTIQNSDEAGQLPEKKPLEEC